MSAALETHPPIRNRLCPHCPFRRSSRQRDSMIRTVMVSASPGEWWPCHLDDPDGWGIVGCAGRAVADQAHLAKEVQP